MHRTDHATADPNKNGSGKSGFVGGNPTAGTPATRFTPEWANDVQENICRTIEGAGIILEKGNYTQLFDAIAAMIAAGIAALSVKQKSLIATAQTFAPGVADGDPVRWDAGNSRWAKAQADGTSNDLGLGLADVTNAEVVLYGETRSGLVSGLTPGAAYYLSATGTLVTTAASDRIRVGVAKSATVLYVDVDAVSWGAGAGLESDGAGNLRLNLAHANAWQGVQSSVSSALSSGVAADFATYQSWSATVNGGTFTISNPTNPVSGASYFVRIAYTTSHQVAWGTNFKGLSWLNFTNTAGAVDELMFYYNGAAFELAGFSMNAGA